MLADRVRMGLKKNGVIDDDIYVATDADFLGTADGGFTYIGTETELKIPTVIKGVNVTSYNSMFYRTTVTTVVSDNPNVTYMGWMFDSSQATSLDLSLFDTSNVTNMSGMFYESQATSLDLSSFDTSNVTNMSGMFESSKATTGYARTQADADRFNNSSSKPSTLVFVVK